LNETLFIVNPTSGSGKSSKAWGSTRRQFEQSGLVFRAVTTGAAGEATALTRTAIQSGVEKVIAVGGDGTLSEVVNGYFDDRGNPINPAAAIGLLPGGTGSDFSRSLGPTSASKLISALLESRSRVVDAARASFTGLSGDPAFRYLINLGSVGFGGDVVGLVNKWRGRLPSWIGGRSRFVLAAITALGRYRNRQAVVVLDETIRLAVETNLIVVANGKFAGGGMMLAPNAQIDDGLLDVVLTDRATRFDVVRELRRVGVGGLLRNPRVTTARAKEVLIESTEPLPIDIDGDLAGYTPASFKVLPSAVRFVV
jgi:YegS/Rv2252/BmrU family lipid kinase